MIGIQDYGPTSRFTGMVFVYIFFNMLSFNHSFPYPGIVFGAKVAAAKMH